MSSIHDPRYKRIIQKLVEAREAANLSQVQLAKWLGVLQPDISKIERCERRIDLLELIDWIKATNNGEYEAVIKFVSELDV